jgi:glucose/arabinose dehydrogenase
VWGATPTLPEPSTSVIPLVNVVDAKGWPDGASPSAVPGTTVGAFARGLSHPRWLYVLPNGDVLVAETNASKRPDDNKGIKGWFFKHYQKKAGGAEPSANRITLLRDADGDGVADTRTVFLSDLNSPFGMALVGNTFYVANTDAVVRFPYTPGVTHIAEPGVKVVDLPAGPLNHHWTKSLVASPDGSKLYVGVGSNSNAAENGIANENERDELGSDLVPDYMTSLRDGGFYGFPYSYYGQHVDKRVKPKRPDLVATAIVPDYALGPHTASLGLAWSGSNALPAQFSNGMFVGQHGSWNRKPRSGYAVIFVPFTEGVPSGSPVEVLTGFVKANGDALGRPVGVAIDSRGGLLVADDVGNTIWRMIGRPAVAR